MAVNCQDCPSLNGEFLCLWVLGRRWNIYKKFVGPWLSNRVGVWYWCNFQKAQVVLICGIYLKMQISQSGMHADEGSGVNFNLLQLGVMSYQCQFCIATFYIMPKYMSQLIQAPLWEILIRPKKNKLLYWSNPPDPNFTHYPRHFYLFIFLRRKNKNKSIIMDIKVGKSQNMQLHARRKWKCLEVPFCYVGMVYVCRYSKYHI